MKPNLKYSFNLPWRGIVFGTLFYAGLSFYLARLAGRASGAAFIFLAALSGMFAIFGLVVLLRRLFFQRVLELADDAILFPHGFPRTRITRVYYADIIRMSENCISGRYGLSLVTARGTFGIGSDRLPDFESYECVKELISTRAEFNLSNPEEPQFSARIKWKHFNQNQVDINWVEPEIWPRYRTHIVKLQPLLPRLVKAGWFFIRCVGFFFVPWFLMKLFEVDTLTAPGFIGAVFPVAFFFTLLYQLYTGHPARATKVSFFSHGIFQLSGKQPRNLNHRECSGWNVVERQFENCIIQILLVQRPTYVFEVALPNADTRERLVQLFNDKKIPHLPDPSTILGIAPVARHFTAR